MGGNRYLLAAIILLIGLFLYGCGGGETKAYLYVESGEVLVNNAGATNEMELKTNDVVKTGANGIATLVLFESETVRLQPNTEVVVSSLSKNNVGIKQNSGQTWNKISKLTGVNSYELQTPDTVATVRGTGFKVWTKDGESGIIVGEGKVLAGKEMKAVPEGKRMNSKKGVLQNLEDLSPEDRVFIKKQLQDDINTMKKVRFRTITKQKRLLALAKKIKPFDENDINKGLDEVDAGRVSEDELLKRYPLKGPLVEKIRKYNRGIREKQELLKKYE